MKADMLTEVTHDAAMAAASHASEPFYMDAKFLVASAFVIFVLIAAKYIWPHIARGLDGRATTIRTQLEQAARLRAEAEALLATYQAQQQQTLRDAQDILDHATRDAAMIRDHAAQELTAALERRTAQAEETIARAEQQAVAQLRSDIVARATELTRTVVAEQLATGKEDPGIARALAAIERQMH